MKIRNSIYAIHNGKEYVVGKEPTGEYYLMSENKNDLEAGFFPSKYNPNLYEKVLKREILGDVYRIETYAIYKGHKFQLVNHGGLMLAATNGRQDQIAKELGFGKEYDGYQKYVTPDELDKIFEEKTLIKDWK